MSNFFKDLKLVGKATATIEALNYQRTELQSLLENTQADLAQANQTNSQTQSNLNQSNNALQTAQSELAELKSKLNHVQGQQSEASDENELLLLQLHQVQEELEHYFLQYQDIKQQRETTQQRLDRVLADNPNYFSYDKIDCEPVSGNTERLHWKINGLLGAGRYWESCQFDTIVEKGIAGFVFSKDEEGRSPLTVWPRPCENEKEVVCIPTGKPDNVQQRAELLKALSTSDWQLIKLLPEVISKAINKSETDAPGSKKLIVALDKTHGIFIKHIPSKVRYDIVELVKTLVHPGYEHLAFRLRNLSYGDRIYPEFQFRLGCANITENNFGNDPKLEFPLVDGKPQLESWYAESIDEFGEKLELRFAEPNDMDLKVWEKLKKMDQKIIAGLISFLNELVESSKGSLENLSRPVDSWTKLAISLSRIFEHHINSMHM